MNWIDMDNFKNSEEGKMNTLQKEEYKILEYFDNFAQEKNLQYILYSGTMLGAVRHEGFIPWDDDIDVAMRRKEYDKFEQLFINHNYQKEDYTYQSRRLNPYQVLPFSKIRSKKLNIIERSPKTQKGNYGPWIDIFPLDNIPNDIKAQKDQYKKVSFYNGLLKKFLLIQVEPQDKGIKRKLKNIIQKTNEKFYKYYFFLPYLFRKRDEYMTMYNDTETDFVADLSYIYYKNYDEYSKFIMPSKDLDKLIKVKFENNYFNIPENFDGILERNYGDYMTIPSESERKVHKIEYL